MASSRNCGISVQNAVNATSFSSYSYTGRTSTGFRPLTAIRATTSRPRTCVSARTDNQRIVCALIEARGVSPIVGLAFVNLDTGEAVMSQINDSQTYVRTLHKLCVYAPSEVLLAASAPQNPSTLYRLISEDENNLAYKVRLLDRRYYAEDSGLEYIKQLAFGEDIEAIKLSIFGNYYAVCCFAVAMRYIEHDLGVVFSQHTLRVKYEPSEGTMMIDVSTMRSLELIQNIRDAKSRLCLFGLLNECLTPMGTRLLRSSILQPSTNTVVIQKRLDAVTELTTRVDVFFATRQALKSFLDAEKILSNLIMKPQEPNLQLNLQAINNIIMLKSFIHAVPAVREAISGARSPLLGQTSQELTVIKYCSSQAINPISEMIDRVINTDIEYARSALELRNQRTYAVKSGVNGLLDIARQTYKEASEDAFDHVTELGETYQLPLELKFDQKRQFYIRFPAARLEGRTLPEVFVHGVKPSKMVECQTLDLVKMNQKITDAHNEVMGMSDLAVSDLTNEILTEMVRLYKCCDSIAMLDMLSAFAHLATSQDYVRPQFGDAVRIRAGRHPIRETFQNQKFVPNDICANQQSRFQIGSFVPATAASFVVLHQLFARVNMDDSIEANVSSFAAEMRDIAFLLRNINARSMAIVDELGRGTSTRDGLTIAIAIAEALISSRALVWFVTHFHDLANILAGRNGVINLHLESTIVSEAGPESMTMLYKVTAGALREKRYGVALAKVVSLPPEVLDIANQVMERLDNTAHGINEEVSAIRALQKKRQLILNLKEQIIQVHSAAIDKPTLVQWMINLQEEFVVLMAKLQDFDGSVGEVKGKDEEMQDS